MNHVNGARTLTLEVLSEGDGLSGRVFSGEGAVLEFKGRIGLMHAIEELLAAADPIAGLAPSRKGGRNES